jgi:hypothetical protein
MRKLAPVFLISIFAIGSASALAMGDRKKEKATTTAPAATAPVTNPAGEGTTPAPQASATPSTTIASSASPAAPAATPATPSPKSSAGRNPAGSSATCKDGKDANGLPCQAPGGNASGPAGAASGSAAGGASSSGSAAGSSSGGR